MANFYLVQSNAHSFLYCPNRWRHSGHTDSMWIKGLQHVTLKWREKTYLATTETCWSFTKSRNRRSVCIWSKRSEGSAMSTVDRYVQCNPAKMNTFETKHIVPYKGVYWSFLEKELVLNQLSIILCVSVIEGCPTVIKLIIPEVRTRQVDLFMNHYSEEACW